MRADGVLQFGVIYDESEGVCVRVMELLEKQLLTLGADYKKTPAKDAEQRDGESGGQDGVDQDGVDQDGGE
jgi:hypothetical protein